MEKITIYEWSWQNKDNTLQDKTFKIIKDANKKGTKTV